MDRISCNIKKSLHQSFFRDKKSLHNWIKSHVENFNVIAFICKLFMIKEIKLSTLDTLTAR